MRLSLTLMLVALAPALAQPPTTCASCIAAIANPTLPFLVWCGGPTQICGISYSNCSSTCTASQLSDCGTSGLPNCSTTGGLPSPSGPSTPLQASAQRLVQGAVAGSILLSLAYGALVLFCAHRPRLVISADPSMEAWKPYAARSFLPFYIGTLLLTLGSLAAIAAIFMPWWMGGLSVSYGGWSAGGNLLISGLTMTAEVCVQDVCASTAAGTSPLVLGAGIVYGAVFSFLLPGALAAGCIACRMRGVLWGVAPPNSMCYPSLPSLQTSVWVGTLVAIVGCAVDWWTSGIIVSVLGASSTAVGNPGLSYTAFAVASLVASCLLFSIVSCCTLGNLPGLGAKPGCCCCCTERDAKAQPRGSRGAVSPVKR
jgi:hypothetical protein